MNNSYSVTKPASDSSEKHIAKLLEESDRPILMYSNSDQYFPFFDIIFLDKYKRPRTVECKLDTFNNSNVAIEYEYKQLPSGLQVTTADFYFIHKQSHDSVYWIKTDDLKRYIIENSLNGVSCNNNTTKCYIVPLSSLTKWPS